MAKKIEINENWEPVEVEDLDNLFIVVFKHGSFDQGYIEAFDTDDVLMQSAYDSLAKQYDETGCDELTKIYLIKVPNTEQTVNMCNTGLFNGNCCDPHVIEATRDLFNRADCEHLSCWEGCGLTEAKKKKKPYSSAYCGFTDPELNIKHFNKCMGTGGLQNPDAPHLVVGDTLPNAPVADAGSSDGASDAGSSAGEGGAVGESLNEDTTKELQIQDNENIEKDIEELEPPIDPEYFPNNIGINLNSVKKEVWTQQDDGQLKSIKVEFDPAEEAEESLNEDLIVIEPNEAREKLTALRNQIEAEKDADVRKSLLTLMNIYLYQTFKPSDRADSTITDDEWREFADWHTAELEKDKQELTEAHLDYSTQLAKMKALEAGTRGFNASSASLEKILYNYDICISHNLPKARKVMENALRIHGWDRYIKSTKKQIDISKYANIFDTGYINSAAVSTVWHNKADPQGLINYYGRNISDTLMVLVIALLMGEKNLADATKDHIINNFTVTLPELKDFLNKGFANAASVVEIKKLIKAHNESLEEDVQLDEAKRYVKRYYVRPLNIFCGNKEDIIQALIRAGDQNCSVYSLKNLDDHEDVHLLQPSDIIYYWDDHVLYDKNHVQVMDYDLFVKHEEERKKVGNIDAVTDAAFSDMYDDRATEDDLKDKDVIANYKALNTISR